MLPEIVTVAATEAPAASSAKAATPTAVRNMERRDAPHRPCLSSMSVSLTKRIDTGRRTQRKPCRIRGEPRADRHFGLCADCTNQHFVDGASILGEVQSTPQGDLSVSTALSVAVEDIQATPLHLVTAPAVDVATREA